jgi:internalin A
MREGHDGLRIARERIATEAMQRTGFLDLGQLGLVELPSELFKLQHLLRLNLGRHRSGER